MVIVVKKISAYIPDMSGSHINHIGRQSLLEYCDSKHVFLDDPSDPKNNGTKNFSRPHQNCVKGHGKLGQQNG